MKSWAQMFFHVSPGQALIGKWVKTVRTEGQVAVQLDPESPEMHLRDPCSSAFILPSSRRKEGKAILL